MLLIFTVLLTVCQRSTAVLAVPQSTSCHSKVSGLRVILHQMTFRMEISLCYDGHQLWGLHTVNTTVCGASILWHHKVLVTSVSLETLGHWKMRLDTRLVVNHRVSTLRDYTGTFVCMCQDA